MLHSSNKVRYNERRDFSQTPQNIIQSWDVNVPFNTSSSENHLEPISLPPSTIQTLQAWHQHSSLATQKVPRPTAEGTRTSAQNQSSTSIFAEKMWYKSLVCKQWRGLCPQLSEVLQLGSQRYRQLLTAAARSCTTWATKPLRNGKRSQAESYQTCPQILAVLTNSYGAFYYIWRGLLKLMDGNVLKTSTPPL